MKLDDHVRQYLKEMAKKGGRARADKLTKEQRSEIARIAGRARWDKQKNA